MATREYIVAGTPAPVLVNATSSTRNEILGGVFLNEGAPASSPASSSGGVGGRFGMFGLGLGGPATVPFEVAPTGWAALDGRGSAPDVPAQHPTMFTGLTGISYPVRPPWHVAGVDYGVGYPTGQVLKDPLVDELPTGATVDAINKQIRCNSTNNLVFDGWDFSLNNGYCPYLNGTTSNTTFIRCKFGPGSNNKPPIQVDSGAGFYYVGYSVFDGGGALFAPNPSAINCGATGGMAVEYCWFKNTKADAINPRAGPLLFRYCLFGDSMYAVGVHADAIQNTLSQTDVVIKFCTFYQPEADGTGYPGCVTAFVHLGAPDVTGTFTGLFIENNTMIGVGATGHNGDSEVAVTYAIELTATNGGVMTAPEITDNYVDPTAMFGAFYPLGLDGIVGAVATGNINLTNGATITAPYA